MHIFAAERKLMLVSQSCKMAEVVRIRLRAWINEISQQLASPNMDSDSQESVFFYRIETLHNTVVRFDVVHGIDGNITNHLSEICIIYHSRQTIAVELSEDPDFIIKSLRASRRVRPRRPGFRRTQFEF